MVPAAGPTTPLTPLSQTARAAQLGKVTSPPVGKRDLAAVEGWIAVPHIGTADIV
jgi:hypothetical protein